MKEALPEQLLYFLSFFQVQEIQDSIYKLHDNLNAMQRALDVQRSTEARDRNLAEENYSHFKVGAWSAFQIILVCTVGSLQYICCAASLKPIQGQMLGRE